jgi:hypothetical protein
MDHTNCLQVAIKTLQFKSIKKTLFLLATVHGDFVSVGTGVNGSNRNKVFLMVLCVGKLHGVCMKKKNCVDTFEVWFCS